MNVMRLSHVDEDMEAMDTDRGGLFVAPELAGRSAGSPYDDGSMSPAFLQRAWREDDPDIQDDSLEGDQYLDHITRILMYNSPTSSPTSSPSIEPLPALQPGDRSGVDTIPSLELPPSIGEALSTEGNASAPVGFPTTAIVAAEAPKTDTPRAAYKASKRPVAVRTFKSTSEVTVTAGGVVKKPHFFSSTPPIDEDLIRREDDAAKRQKKDNDNLKMLKKINSQSRALMNQYSTFSSVRRPLASQRGRRWGQLRVNQILHLSKVLKKDGLPGFTYGFLTQDMAQYVMCLAMKAVDGVLKTEDNYMLQTASAPFWTFALAQEAWQRIKPDPGWHTETQDAADAVSWDAIEGVYKLFLMGAETRFPECHHDQDREDMKSNKERKIGIRRRVVSHGLGQTHKKVKEKMECLHSMLLRGGDANGLHWQIREQMRPDVMSYHAMDGKKTVLQKAKDEAHSHWGKAANKKREYPMYAGEEKDLANVAASCDAMDDTD
jgi:hypothetical protein